MKSIVLIIAITLMSQIGLADNFCTPFSYEPTEPLADGTVRRIVLQASYFNLVNYSSANQELETNQELFPLATHTEHFVGDFNKMDLKIDGCEIRITDEDAKTGNTLTFEISSNLVPFTDFRDNRKAEIGYETSLTWENVDTPYYLSRVACHIDEDSELGKTVVPVLRKCLSNRSD